MPESLQHLLISASAGSGKTYQLVRRYLHLLALGQDAERIAAMTFTRKAAGEFFSRIFQNLAEMAAHPARAEGYFDQMIPAPPQPSDFNALLRQVTRRLHRLRLSTLDSFFAGIVTCFAMDLGLPAGTQVMDEDQHRQALREALDSLLERLYHEESGEASRLLMEAYKQATFGAEEKTVESSLESWLTEGLALWLDSVPASGPARLQDHRGWGELWRIWPKPPEASDLKDAISGVRTHFKPLTPAGEDLLEETLEAIQETVPGMPMPKRTKDLLEKAVEQWSELLAGDAVLTWARKKTPITGQAAKAWVHLIKTLQARELLVSAHRTQGLAGILQILEHEYERAVTRRGRLSFADLQRLLCRTVHQESAWAADQGHLWYRLDSRHQHWLLDEFQDTSLSQWQVIRTLVDEILQDASRERSFFAVGDPKQSIYLWRQAEPDLFDDILKTYQAREDGGGLRLLGMAESRRSAPAVLDAVNAVFGNRELLEPLLPEGTLRGFAFERHEAFYKKLTGHAALLSPHPELESDTPIADMVAELLMHHRPLERGLSCAILTRTNPEARLLTEQLRAATSMNVLCESDHHPCTDNAVTLALLSLLRLIAHPGDSQALEHLRMCPLWPLINAGPEGEDATQMEQATPESPAQDRWRYTLTEEQTRIFNKGFAAFMERWILKIQMSLGGLDAFHRLRLSQMAEMAAEFDASGSRDVDEFVEYARLRPSRSRGKAQAVQVMTIHASKGLEFDMVILPSLDGQRSMSTSRREELLVHRQGSRVEWVLRTPPKVYLQMDTVLGAQAQETSRRTAFESLCRLYVAMTRARRALYLVAKEAPQNARALKESTLLRHMLERQGSRPLKDHGPFASIIEWETGNPAWFADCALREEPEAAAPEISEPPSQVPLGDLVKKHQPAQRRRTPSCEEAFEVQGRQLFGEARDPGRRLGTLVHELLAEVEWQPDLEILEKLWLDRGLLTQEELASADGPSAGAQALKQVRAVLNSPACLPAFVRPGAYGTTWRERSFDLVLDDEWISGTFDRVILERSPEGKPLRAWIVDYKTDVIHTPADLEEKLKGYRPQIKLYRSALAKLAGLLPKDIRCSLLFTRLQQLQEIPA